MPARSELLAFIRASGLDDKLRHDALQNFKDGRPPWGLEAVPDAAALAIARGLTNQGRPAPDLTTPVGQPLRTPLLSELLRALRDPDWAYPSVVGTQGTPHRG